MIIRNSTTRLNICKQIFEFYTLKTLIDEIKEIDYELIVYWNTKPDESQEDVVNQTWKLMCGTTIEHRITSSKKYKTVL